MFFIYIYAWVVVIVVNIVIIATFGFLELKHGFSTPAAPGGATRSPETARTCQVLPALPLAIPGERTGVATKNSASDQFSKFPSQRRQLLTTWYFVHSILAHR